ncbi:MAG: ABC transporter ATP-binding protein [Deltaproteobacteria bacterium]|nr:ABC transporter ATP-binding protein [Deltaproteobacteria bacterium]MBW1736974.1 ABC transporter ATP-binding protein [Deltaproteobacteria bacterium]MBW1908057.1 ABC transporter ATP-binding protein [Deltaproteobacteria bacterium]MBW2032119.1 ABC transporter ATP-binding protein [Deltaproteobacteria bacterium]MBW2113358.1 ABC transporter ATP-binding protein [Deltaproteobacteria bacterium]
MLTVKELESGYGPMQVLWKPSLQVKKGTITALLGPNGVGKSTFLSTVFGSVEPWGGTIHYVGEDVTNLPTHKKVEMGVALVPEGKHLFPNMNVYENLAMGAYVKKALEHKDESMEIVYSLFPRLKERQKQLAGSLSGGEQQMVTIARALMTKPKLMMLDEPSQGLAPVLVQSVFETIQKMRDEIGLTILLVEQNADAALNAAGYVYIMHEGLIKAEGKPEKIKGSSEIREAYLGI